MTNTIVTSAPPTTADKQFVMSGASDKQFVTLWWTLSL